MDDTPSSIGLERKVILLKKALYGLKQAPLKWYISTCFHHYTSIPASLFTLMGVSKTIIVVYVDDLTIVGVRKDLDALVTGLQSQFTVTTKRSSSLATRI